MTCPTCDGGPCGCGYNGADATAKAGTDLAALRVGRAVLELLYAGRAPEAVRKLGRRFVACPSCGTEAGAECHEGCPVRPRHNAWVGDCEAGAVCGHVALCPGAVR